MGNENINVLSFGVIKNYIKKKYFYKKAYFRSFVEDSSFTDILTFFTSKALKVNRKLFEIKPHV